MSEWISVDEIDITEINDEVLCRNGTGESCVLWGYLTTYPNDDLGVSCVSWDGHEAIHNVTDVMKIEPPKP